MTELAVDDAPRRARDLFNKGFAAFEHGNLDYAIDMLYHCVELEPTLLQARKFLRAAEIQRFKQKKGGAISNAVSTVRGLPKMLSVLAGGGKGEKALPAVLKAEQLLQDSPLNLRFIKFFADAAVNAELPEAAIQTLEIAREHYPRNPYVIEAVGRLYLAVGRTKEGRACFELLCQVSPNDPRAVKALKDAMALDSMQKDGWSESAESGGTYRDMMKDEKESVLLEQQAKAKKSDKDVDALIEETREKMAAEPGNLNYYRALARLYIQKASFDEAIAMLAEAQVKSPGDAELDRAMTAARTAQFDAAIARLEADGDAAAVAAKRHERAQFLFEDLQQRVERYPNDLQLRYDYGVMLFDNEYFNEAIQQFQLAQRNPKVRLKTLQYLGLCFKAKDQLDMAVEQLEKANAELTSMSEAKKDVCYELGAIAEAMGDIAKAGDYYKQIYQADIGYKDIAAKIDGLYKQGSGEG